MPIRLVRPKFGPLNTIRNASLKASPWSKKPRKSPLRNDRGAHGTSGKPSPENEDSNKDSPSESKGTSLENLSSALHDTDPRKNSLLAPVHIPEDPNGILKSSHPAAGILTNSGLVIQRQLEMMNVLIGFEQANKYVILDAQGNHIGYMAEQEKGMGNMLSRQWLHTHRPFVAHVFDKHENEVLRFNRPFSWINSLICVHDPLSAPMSGNHEPSSEGALKVSPQDHSQMRIIGAAQQTWAPLRRKYNLFLSPPNPTAETNLGTKSTGQSNPFSSRSQEIQSSIAPEKQLNQFGYVDEPFLSWDFSVLTTDERLMGSVNRNFAGFAREIFTDTGVYALRMDSVGAIEEKSRKEATPEPQVYKSASGMTLDQRAVMLATAVSIDFDYFSRHSSSTPGILPFGLFAGGEGAGAAAGATAGNAAEGVAAGAGTIAGYEAIQKAAEHSGSSQQTQDTSQLPHEGNEEVWGEENHEPWAQGGDHTHPENRHDGSWTGNSDAREDVWSDSNSDSGSDFDDFF